MAPQLKNNPILWKDFEIRKIDPKLCFLRAFTRFRAAGSDRIGSLLSEYLRPFGEKHLGPRPVLLFARGVVRSFYGVATSEEKNRKINPDIYRHFIRKANVVDKSRPKLILEEAGVCRQ